MPLKLFTKKSKQQQQHADILGIKQQQQQPSKKSSGKHRFTTEIYIAAKEENAPGSNYNSPKLLQESSIEIQVSNPYYNNNDDTTTDSSTAVSSLNSSNSNSSGNLSSMEMIQEAKVINVVHPPSQPPNYNKQLYKVRLNHVDCSLGIVTEKKTKSSLQSVVLQERQNSNADVTVVFAIRRPGCGACREHGRQITDELLPLFPEGTVQCMGIIKQINVDNVALLSFYQEYFPFNLYKDEDWAVYKNLLGNRKISPLRLLKLFTKMNKRYKEKNIVNIPFGGDIFTQGGVLIFDRKGNLQHIVHETYGDELNIEHLRDAVESARTVEIQPNMNPY